MEDDDDDHDEKNYDGDGLSSEKSWPDAAVAAVAAVNTDGR